MWEISKRVSKGDYFYAVVPGHPKARKHGYVLEHRVVMENYLQRLLDDGEVVHHRNGDRKDNRVENLELMSNSEHARKHGYQVGRLWLDLRCPNCGALFSRQKNKTHVQKGSKATFCSRSCNGKFYQLYRTTHEVESAISGNIVREYRHFHDNPEETGLTRDP